MYTFYVETTQEFIVSIIEVLKVELLLVQN